MQNRSAIEGWEFATKLSPGLRLTERCQDEGIRLDVVACDSLYSSSRMRAIVHRREHRGSAEMITSLRDLLRSRRLGGEDLFASS